MREQEKEDERRQLKETGVVCIGGKRCQQEEQEAGCALSCFGNIGIGYCPVSLSGALCSNKE